MLVNVPVNKTTLCYAVCNVARGDFRNWTFDYLRLMP